MKLPKTFFLAFVVAGTFVASTPAIAAGKQLPKMISTADLCNNPVTACTVVDQMMKDPRVRMALVKQLSKNKTFIKELQTQLASEGTGG